jgi:hypothetical protein
MVVTVEVKEMPTAKYVKAQKVMLVLMLATSLYAQIPEAPKPSIDRVEWSLLAADASMRVLDVYSTHQMLDNGNRELFLPSAIASHTPAMVTYSASMVALDWWVARKLSHRQRLVHLVTLIDTTQTGYWAIHNLTLTKHKIIDRQYDPH